MFTAIVLMCNIDQSSCWPWVNNNTMESEETCKYAIELLLTSEEMTYYMSDESGWYPESYRCINWEKYSL
jgi:hypothetical protein